MFRGDFVESSGKKQVDIILEPEGQHPLHLVAYDFKPLPLALGSFIFSRLEALTIGAPDEC